MANHLVELLREAKLAEIRDAIVLAMRRRGAEVRPFQKPTGLADGLGVESLPRCHTTTFGTGLPLPLDSLSRKASRSNTLHDGFPAPLDGSRGLGGQAKAECKNGFTPVKKNFHVSTDAGIRIYKYETQPRGKFVMKF